MNRTSLIQFKQLSFVILDAPQDTNVHLYIKELKKQNVTDLVRACEVTYDKAPIEAAGIQVHEFEFPDGESPSDQIIEKWLALVQGVFKSCGNNANRPPLRSIAVHCVAGLGRAPVLVAIALIENGLDPIEAVELIRKYRRGAINLRQLKYLESYEPQRSGGGKCSIM